MFGVICFQKAQIKRKKFRRSQGMRHTTAPHIKDFFGGDEF